MKRRQLCILLIVLLLILVCGLTMLTPERRAKAFVCRHGEAFSSLVQSGEPIPDRWEGHRVAAYAGEHPMYEIFLSSGMGAAYTGVYYSPHDVPLPFQNTRTPLIPDGPGCWRWQAEGDDHGMTKQLTDRWYYFEASF